ncbi:hypothetical protein RM549_04245 [Salegentibacter sp. F188]|uniref:IPT/TIG domain-containing protein n=1 Tax=Autumnicola patrickiae TaxID=3075591 RepID=A0ABU3DZ37_9FLAO|nr:hypothetical protein [Salegentibacter sp. F188]MDT0688981.1 hypothetical protein [Salegentibacter sp. F188]
MKRTNFKIKTVSQLLLMIFTVFSLVSCDSDFDVESIETAEAAPVIHSVSEAREDVPVTQGVLENTYIIRGENLASLVAVYFNGYQASFNPALTTDNLTFVTVPESAPYVGQENTLRLENLYGSTDYDFSLLTIEDFTEGTTEDGIKTVTLIGGDFTDTSEVTFTSGTEEEGNLVERPAEILSVSETEVTVAVPDGVEQAYINLETSRGASAQSDSYGFSYSIYIDQLNPAWSMSQWGGTYDIEATDPALGQYSIQSVREGWSGLTFTPETPIPFNQYTALTVSLYGTGDAGDMVNVAINDFAGTVGVELIPGQWNKVVLPMGSFFPTGGAPAVINRIDFQEASGTSKPQYIFYVDDFGFL